MMMRQTPSSKEPSRLSWRFWLALGALAALALAAFLLLRSRRQDASPPAHGVATKSTSAYENRSILGDREPSGGKAGAARPSISGNVYSMTTGELLPGATVVATSFELAGNIMSPVDSTKSDARGHFKVSLAEGTYQLNASMDGYGPGSVTAKSGDTVSIMLPDSGVIEGHVRD